MEQILNFIGGELKPAISGETLPCFEPATGLEYARLPSSDERDVQAAYLAAESAWTSWRKTTIQERSQVLRKIALKLEQNLERLAKAETKDSGKPIRTSTNLDIPRSILNFNFFADAITQTHGDFYETNSSTINYVRNEPLGVVATISPWNLPLYNLTWKIAPALAAGNCVIAKPSEVTPMTAFLFSQMLQECGVPAGVINIVHGLGQKVGTAISVHPGIKAISFTGSTITGTQINKDVAQTGHVKKLSLEMGGKNPFIVFANADLDLAAEWAVKAAFSNQGQICLCGSRILVEKSILLPFRDLLVNKMSRLHQGDPMESNADQGAMVSREHFDKVMNAIQTARNEGALVLMGGQASQIPGRCEKGWFIQPTLIEGLANNSTTNQEEIFGPVASLIPFENEADAIKIANSVRYGLAASVFTKELNTAHHMIRELQVGTVWINTWMNRDLRVPFGGTKSSGLGREGGTEALHFFTEQKTVCLGGLPS